MESDEPSLASLEQLASSANIEDRAFAASALCLRHAESRDQIEILYDRIRQTAAGQHADLRARIRDGSFDRHAFLAQLGATPLHVRDHFVEEVLDIAYPPQQALPVGRDVTRYSPSGLSEILFTIERAQLAPGKTFVDLGSGLGKVVLLIALLTGAQTYGVELEPRLIDYATGAAQSLRLANARFLQGDIRDAALPEADVYYMFIPSSGSVEAAARLSSFAEQRKLLLFSQTLNLRLLPRLRATSAASYWLEMYEST